MIKTAQQELEDKLAAQYVALSEGDVKTLVVDEKWLATLAAAIQDELGRVSLKITGRIRQLAERYTTPLSQLTEKVDVLASRVERHLEKMGAVWS